MLERLKNMVLAVWGAINTVSGMWLWGWLGGRTFVFIMSALGLASLLEYKGHLEPTYAAVIGTLAGLFTARAVADDYVQFLHKQLTYVPPNGQNPPGAQQ